MKNIIILLYLSIIVFSCQHKTEIEKRNNVVIKDSIVNKELRVDTILDKDLDTLEEKNNVQPKPKDYDVIVKLPNNSHAIITLEAYLEKEQIYEWLTWSYKPKGIKVYDDKTKKQVPQIQLNNYYADERDSSGNYNVKYGDFNFDGKMDIAVRGRESGYRSFCYWNFFLATTKGYKFSKSFSEIMDDAIAYLKLDVKNKRILAYREAEYYNCSEYKIKSNKAELVKQTTASHNPSPFISYSEILWKGKKWTKTKDYRTINNYITEDEKYKVLFFNIPTSQKNIMLFIDDTYFDELCYVEIKNDSIVDFDYSKNFVYNIKNNILVFRNKNKTYKVYESKTSLGVEIKSKGKTMKLIGNIKSKKGNLSRIIDLEKNKEENTNSNFHNVTIEK